MQFNPKGSFADCFAVIKDIAVKTSKSGGSYLDINLQDKNDTINAKLWDYSPIIHGTYSAGDLVKVRGTVSKYNNTDQLKIDKIRLATPADNVNPADFVKTADADPLEMYNALYNIANGFSDETLKIITTEILTRYKEKLLIWPAAFKLHHAVRGGLLFHTLSIVRIAQSVSKIYPFLDEELLLAGAILHDVCKTEELDATDLGVSTGYTVKGNLLGHLAAGASLIENVAIEKNINNNNETVVLLMHMLLSHHGCPEYGAAVLPSFAEAQVLSILDNLDASLYEFCAETENIEKGEFSGRVPFLDGRKVYNHGRAKNAKTKIL